jgi:hypothetical protein
MRTARKGKLPYLEVALSHEGEPRSFLVHRLVALAFHGESPIDRPIATHRDGDPQNNRPDNLAWATQSENLFDRYRHARARRLTDCVPQAAANTAFLTDCGNVIERKNVLG